MGEGTVGISGRGEVGDGYYSVGKKGIKYNCLKCFDRVYGCFDFGYF